MIEGIRLRGQTSQSLLKTFLSYQKPIHHESFRFSESDDLT